MKQYNFLSVFFILALIGCVPSKSAATQVQKPKETLTPHPISTESTTSTLTITPTKILNGYTYFGYLEGKVNFEELRCEYIAWEEVGIEVKTGSVQPFAISGQHAQPDAEVLCFGYFVVPAQPGDGYFVYKDQEKRLQILRVTYEQNDIDQNVFKLFKNTTPTPLP